MKYSVDEKGFYGQFGGAYVPEMLHPNVEELRDNYLKIMQEPSFKEELDDFHELSRRGGWSTSLTSHLQRGSVLLQGFVCAVLCMPVHAFDIILVAHQHRVRELPVQISHRIDAFSFLQFFLVVPHVFDLIQ